MKAAENIIKKNAQFLMDNMGMTEEEAMKKALEIAEQTEKNAARRVNIAKWFLVKNFSQSERMIVEASDSAEIDSETEKAVFVKFISDYGTISKWVPKACLI